MSRRRKAPKLPRDPITCTVTSLSHDGRGIAEHNGKKIFIDAALPGETVEVIYTGKRSQFDEGRVANVIEAAESRIKPRCEHFGTCGGCSMQHLSREDQIAHKQTVLVEQFNHFAKIDIPEIIPPLTADAWGYRRKARLGVRVVAKKGGVLVGFREKYNPRLLTDMQSCEVLDSKIASLLPSLRDLISQLSQPHEIPQIEVAVGDDESALIFRHLVALSDNDLTLFKTYGEEHNLHIYLQPKGLDSTHKLYPEVGETLLHYYLPEFDCRLAFHPQDFTQVNAQLNQRMLALAIELLQPNADETILDLFCGLGNFSLPIATRCKHLVGVEGDEKMVKRATANAALNHLINTEFYSADLTKDFTTADWAKQRFDKILIDPPRTGALEIIQHFPHFMPKRIVYVSCNPATLARDTAELLKQGYHLEKAGVMDMFPQTSHVESIAVFNRE